jgi:hypothetical protein
MQIRHAWKGCVSLIWLTPGTTVALIEEMHIYKAHLLFDAPFIGSFWLLAISWSYTGFNNCIVPVEATSNRRHRWIIPMHIYRAIDGSHTCIYLLIKPNNQILHKVYCFDQISHINHIATESNTKSLILCSSISSWVMKFSP